LKEFALWLSATWPSVLIQTHNDWVIPTIQSVHIAGIGIVLTSVFMMDLRILGLAGKDQTLRQVTNRFGPWLMWSLVALLVTGVLMVIGEPVRELVTVSFWLKMFLVAVGTLVAALFLRALQKNEPRWEEAMTRRFSIKLMAIFTFLVWLAVVVLGRLIAYDHIWGAWSPAQRL
jgi:SNF family Na+-dependent transporter